MCADLTGNGNLGRICGLCMFVRPLCSFGEPAGSTQCVCSLVVMYSVLDISFGYAINRRMHTRMVHVCGDCVLHNFQAEFVGNSIVYLVQCDHFDLVMTAPVLDSGRVLLLSLRPWCSGEHVFMHTRIFRAM